MPRKAEKERIDGLPVGKGVPAGIIRNPVKLPPMQRIQDGGELPFDSDEDYAVDELLGDELAKVEERLG